MFRFIDYAISHARLTIAVLLFLLVHVIQVIRAGFRVQMRAMTVGVANR